METYCRTPMTVLVEKTAIFPNTAYPPNFHYNVVEIFTIMREQMKNRGVPVDVDRLF